MTFDEAMDIVNKHALDMLDDPKSDIELVGVGNKERRAITESKDFCVTALVREKLTSTELQKRKLRAFDSVYAASVGSTPASCEIDVVECGGPLDPQIGLQVPSAQRGLYGGNPPALNAQKDFRTLRCGIGITNPHGAYPNSLSAGTLGFFVRDDSGETYLVSNNHVIGRLNNAQNGEPVVQPGTLDLTSNELQLMPTLKKLVATTQVANVSAVVPIQFKTPQNTPNNRVDVAMARLTDARSHADIDRLTFGGGILGVAAPYQQDPDGSIAGSARVFKVGRTTGYTEGEVFILGGARTVNYGGQSAHFVGQILVQPTADNVGPFSDRGDSGSGVFNDRNELVGLLFAGNTNFTIVNPMDRVLTDLAASFGGALNVVTI